MAPNFFSSLAQRFGALDNAALGYAARRRAWHAFERLGLPTLKTEAYRYTPIASILASAFDQGVPWTSVTEVAVDAAQTLDLDAYAIVLLNGRLHEVHAPPSVQVAASAEGRWVADGASSADPFAALNAALFDQELVVRLADGVVLDKPLVIYHWTDARQQSAMACPRIRVEGGERSQASVVTAWHTGGEGVGWTNAVVEVSLAAEARLDYYTLHTQPGQRAHYVTNVHCQLGRQSVLNAYTFVWGGALVRNNLRVDVNASYAATNLYGLYYPCGQQHVDNYTQVDHRQPHTCSNELYKGIVADEATGVFNGAICVRQGAQKTRAFQRNNNLVLSDGAKVHTKPQLEIWADDVKCSHGATTGQLAAEQLFYLRTRGITEPVARQLLLQAFASEVTDRVPLAALRDCLTNLLSAVRVSPLCR